MELKRDSVINSIAIVLMLVINSIGCNDEKMNDKNEAQSNYHYWIQRYDYSSKEFKNISLKQAIMAFNDYDWEKELSSFQEGSGGKDCPPGIGIHNDYDGVKKRGKLLHICPNDKAGVFFNFHYFTYERSLFILKSKKENIHYVKDYPKNRVPELIKLFFDNKIHKILDIE